MKIEIVGEYDRIERGLVAVELLLVPRALPSVEIAVAQVLRFDEERRRSGLFLHDVVRCPAARALGLVDRLQHRRKGVEEDPERPAKGMFRCYAHSGKPGHLCDICRYCCEFLFIHG